jgi:flagellar biosynthesis GTPase FlhF
MSVTSPAPHAENAPETSLPKQAAPAMPPEIPAYLVRSVAPRVLWQWLQNQERAGVLQAIARGFQQSQRVLQQPVVRSRLADILTRDEELFSQFLQLWSEAKPTVLAEAETLPAENFDEPLKAIIEHHGLAAVAAALIHFQRGDVLDALENLDAPADVSTHQDDTNDQTSLQNEVATLRKSWQEAKKRAETAQRRADENQKRAEQWKSELTSHKSHSAQETRELQTRLKAAERRAQASEESLEETKQRLDRAERRLRQSESALEETQVENKRLRRQLRQSQQLHEELRRQIAGLGARIRELELAAQKPAATETKTAIPAVKAKPSSTRNAKPSLAPVQVSRPVDVHPLDQLFMWNADGRNVRITARELVDDINRNDEEKVFSIIQALDALREQNSDAYRMFIGRVREAGRYYARVITTETTRVLVDASNVARYEKDARGRGQLCNLLAMREELRRRDCFPIKLIADASLPFNIDERGELLAMAKRGEVEIAPTGVEADEILAREARRTGAYVVTNDRNFHLKVAPDFEPPRLAFRARDGVIELEDF